MADKRLMLGVVLESVEVEGTGSETRTGMGSGTELETEILHILVSSKEDTIEGTRQEVTDPQTDATKGLGSDGGVGGESI